MKKFKHEKLGITVQGIINDNGVLHGVVKKSSNPYISIGQDIRDEVSSSEWVEIIQNKEPKKVKVKTKKVKDANDSGPITEKDLGS